MDDGQGGAALAGSTHKTLGVVRLGTKKEFSGLLALLLDGGERCSGPA